MVLIDVPYPATRNLFLQCFLLLFSAETLGLECVFPFYLSTPLIYRRLRLPTAFLFIFLLVLDRC